MNVKIIKSVKDDFHEMSGPSQTTHAFLSIDGMLFELGRFYEGPHMNRDTGKRLAKVLEFEKECAAEMNNLRDENKRLRDALEGLMDMDISGIKYGAPAKEAWEAAIEALKA